MDPGARRASFARVRPAVIASITCIATAAVADEPVREVQGETIVVTGLRLPRPVRDVPPAVTVLERQQIEKSPQHLIDDILRTLPSVGTFRRSSSAIADPTSQGVNLRGIGPSAMSRGLVLRDGVPINDPFGGWVYWRAISPFAIDRVEVAPSGASARLAHDPHHRTTASITFDDARLATIIGQLRYLGPMFEDDLNTLPIGAVVLFDARIARVLGHGITAFAAAENLLDRRYVVGRAGIDTLGAPRTIELGLVLATR